MKSEGFWKGGFHGKMPFDAENIRGKWSAMTDEEKEACIQSRKECFRRFQNHHGFGKHQHQILTKVIIPSFSKL